MHDNAAGYHLKPHKLALTLHPTKVNWVSPVKSSGYIARRATGSIRNTTGGSATFKEVNRLACAGRVCQGRCFSRHATQRFTRREPAVPNPRQNGGAVAQPVGRVLDGPATARLKEFLWPRCRLAAPLARPRRHPRHSGPGHLAGMWHGSVRYPRLHTATTDVDRSKRRPLERPSPKHPRRTQPPVDTLRAPPCRLARLKGTGRPPWNSWPTSRCHDL